jgi:hypothetical protein
MINFFIQVENGQTVNHPAFESNLIQAFGEIPKNWERFVRVDCPVATMYQVFDTIDPTYQKINGVWTDVWSLRDMTAEEIAAKQQQVKDDWSSLPNRDNFTTWQFNEATCSFEPPVPYPETGNYRWSGADNTWVEVTLPEVEIGITRV